VTSNLSDPAATSYSPSSAPTVEVKSFRDPETQPAHNPWKVGTWFLSNIWYYAVPSESLKRGKMISKIIANEPILIGRDSDGKVFAMRDICPHQAVPLSDGRFDGKQVECCFHGWTFGTDGVCTDIPTLLPEQPFEVCKMRAKSFRCGEEQGGIWVYFGDKTKDLPSIPTAPGLENQTFSKTTTTLVLPHHIDYAGLALIDTAHVPYVHNAWWWRSNKGMYLKQKTYVPSERGWTMVKHKPSKNAKIFQLIGGSIETEISFCLPACRREYLSFRGKTFLSGITTLTPIDETHTELNHTTFWTIPFVAPLVTPIVQYFVSTFLGQDLHIATRQATRMKYQPELTLTVPDSGTPGAWYLQLKKEWMQAYQQDRPFVNPVKESILRWKT
jgi:phenylpropionate dioxygenase-like ring-hydroxylating dioxygenase large terminal subunit